MYSHLSVDNFEFSAVSESYLTFFCSFEVCGEAQMRWLRRTADGPEDQPIRALSQSYCRFACDGFANLRLKCVSDWGTTT